MLHAVQRRLRRGEETTAQADFIQQLDQTMKLPKELEQLLRDHGAIAAAMPIIRAIAGHWKTPANYERNIREMVKNDDGKLFYQVRRKKP